MMSIVVAVILLILYGWATPSESAAFGCLGVLLLAIAYRRLTWQGFVASVTGALRVTTMAPDTRRLVQLIIDNGDATLQTMDMLLAKKRSGDRKSWLGEKGDQAEVAGFCPADLYV